MSHQGSADISTGLRETPEEEEEEKGDERGGIVGGKRIGGRGERRQRVPEKRGEGRREEKLRHCDGWRWEENRPEKPRSSLSPLSLLSLSVSFSLHPSLSLPLPL